MKHTLESYRVFPYIAWTLFIGFALFTYHLTIKASAEISALEANHAARAAATSAATTRD